MSDTLRISRSALTAMALAGALVLGFTATGFAAGKPAMEPAAAAATQGQQDWTSPAPANHTQPISTTMSGMGWG
jgi:hypothetical protein